MKLKTIFSKISFFPVTLCVVACFLCCFYSQTKQANANNYDYSLSNDKYTLNAKDIFVKEIGEPNELEEDYLSSLDYKLSYSENPEKGNVITSLIDKKLYVFAYKYTGVGTNGENVEWIPDSFTFNNEKFNFVLEGDHYVGIADNYSKQKDELVVKYTFDAPIEKEDAEEIFNGAYNYGKEQNAIKDSQIAEYNAAKAKYDQYLLDLEAYNQNKIEWDNYDAATESYNIYLEKYNDYQAKNAKYLENKAAWDEYNEQYAKYIKYLSDLAYYNENHEQNLIDYNNFYPTYQKFEYRLNAMNLIYKNMAPINRNIYDQVMGDSVTQVLNQKNDLVALGVDEDVIDKAYEATLELRIIFEAYKSKATDEQRYSYYKNNYFVIKTNVEDLLRALDKLYRSAFVPEAIASMGKDKTQKYLNLVAQLAYLANAIDDKDIYNYEGWNGISGSLKRSGAKLIDDSWTFIGKTWRQYLEGEEFLDVNSDTLTAYPLESKFPSEVVVLLEEPEPVEEPTAPTEVLTEPVEPEKVEQPQKPTNKLEKPEVVNEPKLSDYLTSSEKEYIYAEAYKNGELVQHKEITEKEYIKFECSVSINIEDKIQKVCRFLNYDGTYLWQDFFNSHPIYNGKTPFKEQDEMFNDYLFQGWDDLNDNAIELSNIEESCEIKARYLGRNLDEFDITYIIGDRTETITCYVGYLPTLPDDISIPETDTHFYVFSDWDKELEVVHKAETYTAIFEEKNKYTIEFDINGTLTSQIVKEGELPNIPINPSKPDSDNNYYEFIGWDQDITNAECNKKYTALFSEHKYVVISWSIDGNVQKEQFKPGATVKFTGETPLKNNDADYYYLFTGWDKTLGFEAAEDLTITAEFEQKRFIHATWYINEATISKDFKQDELVVNPIVDSYFDDCYVYTLNRFEKLSSSTKYDMYFTAKFDRDYILYSHNVGVRIYVQNNIINIYLNDQKDIDLSPLFNLFDQGYQMGDIKIHGNSYSIVISRLQLQLLINKGCHTISLNYNNVGNKEYSFSVDLLDGNNQKLQDIGNALIKLEINDTFDSLRSFVYSNDIKQTADLTDTSVTLDVKPCTKYDIYPIYSVTILDVDGAEIRSSALSGRFGDEIVLEYTINQGFIFQNFVISETNGQICNTTEKYTIKGYDITIGMTVSKIQYTINFYVDGEIYATSYVFYGEKINPPEYVSKLSTETTRYVFEGWDKNVEVAYQNEDFHAIFSEIEIPKPPVNNKVSVVTIAEIVVISVLSLAIVGALLIIFRKKIFKRH